MSKFLFFLVSSVRNLLGRFGGEEITGAGVKERKDFTLELQQKNL